MIAKHSVVPYAALPASALFKALIPELIVVETGKRIPFKNRKGNEVDNKGTFVKIGDSHAVNIADHRDAIFRGDMPCRIISTKVDSSHLPDWKVANQGRPYHG